MNNLIIGVIKNYDWSDLKPFVLSLEKVGYKGDCVFFYNNVNDETVALLKQHGVTPIHFSDDYPYVADDLRKDMGIIPPTYPRKIHIFSMRYIPYYLYLKNCGKKYDHIMVTDVRDVVFQKDPFDFPIEGHLSSFLEDAEWPIKKSLFNYVEIEKAFGKEEADKIGDNLISCCGVTIGPGNLIIQYLEKLIGFILAGDGSIVMDQGTHNYIIWNNLVPNIKNYKNHEGPVLTLGYEKKIYKNKDGLVTDRNGNVVNIVHQYDRHVLFAMGYYDTTAKKRFIKKVIGGYKKKINDSSSLIIKKISPSLHARLKKLKHSL